MRNFSLGIYRLFDPHTKFCMVSCSSDVVAADHQACRDLTPGMMFQLLVSLASAFTQLSDADPFKTLHSILFPASLTHTIVSRLEITLAQIMLL
jgi:hypothetical protein